MEKVEIKSEADMPPLISYQLLRDWTEPDCGLREVAKAENNDDRTTDNDSSSELMSEMELEDKSSSEGIADVKEEILQSNDNHSSEKVSDKIMSKNREKELYTSTRKIKEKVDLLIEEICRNAPVSEQFGKCVFQCPKCNAQPNTWRKLVRHCAIKHSVSVSLLDIKIMLRKPVVYICKICSTKLLSDSFFVTRHLAKHKMQIAQYVDKFEPEMSKWLSKFTLSVNVIGNLCLYECQKCKQIYKSKKGLQRHHKTCVPNEKPNIRASIKKGVYHQCLICQKPILCELYSLSNHFARMHHLSPEKYCETTGCELKSVFVQYGNKVQVAIHNNIECWPTDSKLYTGKSETPTVEKKKLTALLIKKVCKNSPVSPKIENMCLFKCFKCEDFFKSWQTLKNHVMKVHSSRNIGMTQVSKLIAKAVSHKCKVCNEVMLCDNYFITWHLRQHDMKVSQYIQKHIYTSPINRPKVLNSQNVIGNLCVYECGECKQIFGSKALFSKHKTEEMHNTQLTPKECLTKKVIHRCKLCNSSLLCEKAGLSEHFKGIHCISLEEYCKKTGCTVTSDTDKYAAVSKLALESLEVSHGLEKTCVFACDKCGEKYSPLCDFKKHYIEKHSINIFKSWSYYMVKGFSFKCTICFKLLLCDKYIIQAHMKQRHSVTTTNNKKRAAIFKKHIEYLNLCDSFIQSTPISNITWHKTLLPMDQVPIQEITPKIGNLCSFTCPECDLTHVSPNWQMFVKHCRKVHGFYIRYKPSLLSVARCHACLLCPKAVLCDRSFISKHLATHNMKLKKYESIYQQNGGEILPTFIEWKTLSHETSEEPK